MNKSININTNREDFVKTFKSKVGTNAEKFEIRYTYSGVVIAKMGKDVLFVPANLVTDVAQAMLTVNEEKESDE